jgi:hypothetical protein
VNRLPPGQRAQTNAQPRQQPPCTRGTVDRVPCPHCGRHNDFRELDGQQLLDTGHKVICRGENQGEGCGQIMEVVAIQVVKVVAVRPIRLSDQQHRQALTMSASQLQRYLKG